tara:strand:- start:84 stop:368 length:285 start_codon:yes stop_codon:yes gene_type:complete
MRVNAGDSIPISGKEKEAPRDCGCKRREGEKLLDKKILVESDLKLFRKILTLGEWAPLFFGAFQAYPHLNIPQGVSRGTGLVWQGIDQGHDVRP